MKTVIITTAENMSEEAYRRICDGFKERLGEDAEFKHITDNGIIGGFVDGEIYDLSISSQLKKMQKEING